MAMDIVQTGIASSKTALSNYLSGWSVDETAGGGGALVNFRDSLNPPTAPSMVETASAGNPTAGVHYAMVTWVTEVGESNWIDAAVSASINLVGSKIVTVTIPNYDPSLTGRGLTAGGMRNTVVGRNVYVTKAGAPAAATTPKIAQFFLVVANPSTTIAAGSTLFPLPQATINLTSSAGFAAGGGIAVVTTDLGPQAVTYTAAAANQLTGCTGGRGFMTTGNAVTQATVPDNTTTTFSWNVVDGSLTATNPPAKNTSGGILRPARPNASGSLGDDFGPNVLNLQNGGQVYVEVNTGTVLWSATGH